MIALHAQIAKDVTGHAHLQMSLLRIKEGRPMSVGDIVANVEQVDEKVGHFSLISCLTYAQTY